MNGSHTTNRWRSYDGKVQYSHQRRRHNFRSVKHVTASYHRREAWSDVLEISWALPGTMPRENAAAMEK